MKKTLITALCISLMIFTCGCMSSNDTGKDVTDSMQDMADDAGNAIEDIAQSIFPEDLTAKDSEYFKVTDYSTKDTTVTLKGAVMKKSTADDGKIEYEYGKQDSELTFDADHAEIKHKDEGAASGTTVKFSEYVKKQGDYIKDKIYKVDIKDGRVTGLEEAGYTDK